MSAFTDGPRAEGLRALAGDPFDLLRALDSRLQRARLDTVAGRSDRWTGLAMRLAGRPMLAPQRDVREVIVKPVLTRIPNAKPWLLGLANVRGALLTVVDPAALLGLATQPDSRASRVAVLNSEHSAVGFLVDEVSGYRSFEPADQVDAGPMGDADALAQCRLGAFERDGQRWMVLSFHRMMQLPQARQAGW